MVMNTLGDYEGYPVQELINDGWSIVCKTKIYQKGQKTRAKALAVTPKKTVSKPKRRKADNEVILPSRSEFSEKITKEAINEYLVKFATDRIMSNMAIYPFGVMFSSFYASGKKVVDIVMDSVEYNKFRGLCKDHITVVTEANKITLGLLAYLWGARVWVNKDVKGIKCYAVKVANSRYPYIAKAKKELGIVD
jgi:hypothetical protein